MSDDFLPDQKDRRTQIRNLHQYKNMTDEEFEEVYQKITNNTLEDPYFERRIKSELAKFEKDYDVSDLKINDNLTMRALIQSMIALEDYEQLTWRLQRELKGDNNTNDIMSKIDKLEKIKIGLREGISRMQDDLKISRKIRKSEREDSVISVIADLKERSKKFYDKKFARVFCPDCKLLLGSVWTLYSDNPNNKFWFYCKRCDKRVIITFPELVKAGMKNIDDVPDF